MKISRKDAINFIALYQLMNLEEDIKNDILLDVSGDEILTDIESSKEILEYLKGKFIGVLNSYLSLKIKEKIKIEFLEVEGEFTELIDCVCCSYKTIQNKFSYEICPVCFWEDDGVLDLKKYSSPNHMSLEEAKATFKKIGAISMKFIKSVDTNGKIKYPSGASIRNNPDGADF